MAFRVLPRRGDPEPLARGFPDSTFAPDSIPAPGSVSALAHAHVADMFRSAHSAEIFNVEIFNVEIARLKDEGATSSQGLEIQEDARIG